MILITKTQRTTTQSVSAQNQTSCRVSDRWTSRISSQCRVSRKSYPGFNASFHDFGMYENDADYWWITMPSLDTSVGAHGSRSLRGGFNKASRSSIARSRPRSSRGRRHDLWWRPTHLPAGSAMAAGRPPNNVDGPHCRPRGRRYYRILTHGRTSSRVTTSTTPIVRIPGLLHSFREWQELQRHMRRTPSWTTTGRNPCAPRKHTWRRSCPSHLASRRRLERRGFLHDQGHG